MAGMTEAAGPHIPSLGRFCIPRRRQSVERARHTEAASSARSAGVASNHAMQASTKKKSMETYRQFRGGVTARVFPTLSIPTIFDCPHWSEFGFGPFIVLKYPSLIQLSLILQGTQVVSAQSAQRTVYQSDPIERAIVPVLAWTRLYRIPLLFQFLCQLSWVV
jgi:hypothetical protein